MTSEIINGVAQRARGIRYIPQKFGGSQSQTVGTSLFRSRLMTFCLRVGSG